MSSETWGPDQRRAQESPRAIILAADDDANDRDVLERELRKRYGADYDVVIEATGAAALRTLESRGERGQQVALVLASQSMSDIEGTALLGRVAALQPTARRGLLVMWGDPAPAAAILQAIALGQFDYYVPKPATAPDEAFHAVIGTFLSDWARDVGRRFAPVVVVGERSNPRVHELRDLLQRNGLAHRVLDPASEQGAAIRRDAGATGVTGPVVTVLGAPAIIDPSNAQIAAAMGVNTAELGRRFDIAVVGAGPAGLGAAVYAASEGLDTLVLEREALGGQAGTSSRIRNYLGFPTGVSGSDLATRAYEQAWLFGAKFHFMHDANSLRPLSEAYAVMLSDGTEIVARTVVLATGVTYRRLEVPSIDDFIGNGVFYGAAVTEAPTLRGQRVFVVGGGNSAGQAAIHLAKFAGSVTILVRGAGLTLGMSDYLITEIGAHPKIDVRAHTEVTGCEGTGRLESLTLSDTRTGATETVAASALFVLIGARPHTDWLPEEIVRDEWGFVVTGPDLMRADVSAQSWPRSRPPMSLETSAPGVFAVGDVRHRSVKRVASAVGEGATCIAVVHEYLRSESSGGATP
jgi:thioredoxin reductase (NADPH)